MDKEMQLKLKLAMNQLEAACESMEMIVEACCEEEEPIMGMSKGRIRNKMLMIDTGSSTEE